MLVPLLECVLWLALQNDDSQCLSTKSNLQLLLKLHAANEYSPHGPFLTNSVVLKLICVGLDEGIDSCTRGISGLVLSYGPNAWSLYFLCSISSSGVSYIDSSHVTKFIPKYS